MLIFEAMKKKLKKGLPGCLFLLFLISSSVDAQTPLNPIGEFNTLESNSQYGWRALLADVDGDGAPEVVVSARMGAPNGIRAAGSVFIYTAAGALISKIDGDQEDEAFGEWVLAKDLDNDERDELIIGAPGYTQTDREGAVYIYSHPADVWIQKNRLVGEFSRSCLGRIHSVSPDLDGDGVDELLLGAPCNPVRGILNQGSVYIVSGKKAFDGDSLEDATIKRWDTDVKWDPVAQTYQPSETFYFGSCLDGLGDIDGDGTPDFIVSAATSTDRRLDPGLTDQRGVAFIFSGKQVMGNVPFQDAVLFKIAGAIPKQWFGNVVMRIGAPNGKGDLDGDDVADILIGAPGNDPSVTGSVYVYSGAKAAMLGEILDPNNSALIVRIEGETAGDAFGYSVADVGYVDGDAVHDFAVGAQLADAGSNGNVGKVYLYSGGSFNRIGTFEGQAAGERLGKFVSGTSQKGSIDGRAVFTAGAPHAEGNTGKAYLFSSNAIPPSPLPDDASPAASSSSPSPQSLDSSGDANTTILSSSDAGTTPPPANISSSPTDPVTGSVAEPTATSSGAATDSSSSGGGGCSINTLVQPKPGDIVATLILMGLPFWSSISKVTFKYLSKGGGFMKENPGLLFIISLSFLMLPYSAWAAGNQTNKTLTINTGMGVNNGTNKNMTTNGDDGVQCAGMGAQDCEGGPFADTTDPFNPNHDCSNAFTTSPVCTSSFDPNLPGGFTVVDNRFGRGAPCGPNDTSGPPFPYPCHTKGSVNQIIPLGIDDPNSPYIILSPPSLGGVGQPFYQFRSDSFGNLRVNHIEYGFDQFIEADTTQILRVFFTVDSTTDSNGQLVGNAVGSFKMLIQDGSGAGCDVTTSNSSSEGRFESGSTGVVTCIDRNGNLCPSPQFSPGRWAETSFRCLP
jgi:hypothetical protein